MFFNTCQQVSCGFNGADKKTKCSKNSSCVFTLQKRPEPPTSEPTTNKCSVTIDTDDNIYFNKLPAHSENSATEDQNDYANNSGIYIIPLPDIMYDTTDDGTRSKHMPNPKTCKNTDTSPCVSRAPCESSADKPGSRWFGLNLSEINLS